MTTKKLTDEDLLTYLLYSKPSRTFVGVHICYEIFILCRFTLQDTIEKTQHYPIGFLQKGE